MFKLMKNFEKKDYLLIILVIFLIIAQVWLDLKMPDYMSEITMLVKTEGSKMSDILYNGGLMLLCSFGSLISTIISGYFLALLASGFSSKLREKIFYKVENLSIDKIKQFETSSLITRTTNDISQVEMLISMGLQLLIKAPITAIWAICKIVNKSFSWTLATSICVLIMLSVVTILTIIVIPKFKVVQIFLIGNRIFKQIFNYFNLCNTNRNIFICFINFIYNFIIQIFKFIQYFIHIITN